MSATSDTCLGNDCPQYSDCYVTKMRQRAAESDVVIVNHHLLCADASVRQSTYGEVIPECKYAVLDEAHQLEDVATQYFGIAVSNYRIDELGRDAERVLNMGAIEDPDSTLRRLVRRVDDHARTFFAGLAQTRHTRALDFGEERLRIGPDWYGDVIDDGPRAGQRAQRSRSGAGAAGRTGAAAGRRSTRMPRRSRGGPASCAIR